RMVGMAQQMPAFVQEKARDSSRSTGPEIVMIHMNKSRRTTTAGRIVFLTMRAIRDLGVPAEDPPRRQHTRDLVVRRCADRHIPVDQRETLVDLGEVL